LRDPAGRDLRYVKFIGVPGDGGVVGDAGVATHDGELRAAASADRFTWPAGCSGPRRVLRRRPARARAGSHGWLVNRLRRFVDDGGRPSRSVSARSATPTPANPLYGGLHTGLGPGGPAGQRSPTTGRPRRQTRPTGGLRPQVEPWVPLGVELDRAGADPAGAAPAGLAGSGGAGPGRDVRTAATDPVIGRALVRSGTCWSRPRPDGRRRLMATWRVMAHPEDHRCPPGGTRVALLGPATRGSAACLTKRSVPARCRPKGRLTWSRPAERGRSCAGHGFPNWRTRGATSCPPSRGPATGPSPRPAGYGRSNRLARSRTTTSTT
jgi:hypothetical protein